MTYSNISQENLKNFLKVAGENGVKIDSSEGEIEKGYWNAILEGHGFKFTAEYRNESLDVEIIARTNPFAHFVSDTAVFKILEEYLPK